MMQHHQGVHTDESNELKTRSSHVEEDGNLTGLPDSTPSTPAARNRFPLARNGIDSGYGTDYSPSPSSSTSTRRFVFNDEIVAGRNTSTSNYTELLSERLQTIQLESRAHLCTDSDNKDEAVFDDIELVTDELDKEVININANQSASCNAGISKAERPRAPHPCSKTFESDVDNLVGFGDRTDYLLANGRGIPSMVRPLPGMGDIPNNTSSVDPQLFPNSDSPMSPAQTEREKNRSYSLPNVQTLQREPREQAVGRQLRRLSDEFFHFHCHRRRRRALSVESSPFPVQVNIDIYAGTARTAGQTGYDADSDEETNSRHSEEQ